MNGATAAPAVPAAVTGNDGVFETVDEAVKAAAEAQKKVAALSLEDRGRIISIIRGLCESRKQEFGKLELDETGLGRLDHKLQKLEIVKNVLGVEAMRSDARTDKYGMCLIERAPWGVIGMVLPATHPIPTLASNAINVIAAGNTAVFSPHPVGAKAACYALQSIQSPRSARNLGIANALATVREPEYPFRGRDLQASGHCAAVRDRRSGGGAGREQAWQARHCRGTGQSAGGGG